MELIAEPTSLWVSVVLLVGGPLMLAAACVAGGIWSIRKSHPVAAFPIVLPVPLLIAWSILVLAGVATWGS